jgi:hypothetical protein
MNGKLASVLPLAMLMMGSSMPQTREVSEITGEKFKVCPKGCNHYRFNSIGKFTINRHMDRQEYGVPVFECFAINDKSAVKKFNKRNK